APAPPVQQRCCLAGGIETRHVRSSQSIYRDPAEMRQGARRDSDWLVLPVEAADQAAQVVSARQIGFPKLLRNLPEIEPDRIAVAAAFEDFGCDGARYDLADVGRPLAVPLLGGCSLSVLGQDAVEEAFAPHISICRMQARLAGQ